MDFLTGTNINKSCIDQKLWVDLVFITAGLTAALFGAAVYLHLGGLSLPNASYFALAHWGLALGILIIEIVWRCAHCCQSNINDAELPQTDPSLLTNNISPIEVTTEPVTAPPSSIAVLPTQNVTNNSTHSTTMPQTSSSKTKPSSLLPIHDLDKKEVISSNQKGSLTMYITTRRCEIQPCFNPDLTQEAFYDQQIETLTLISEYLAPIEGIKFIFGGREMFHETHKNKDMGYVYKSYGFDKTSKSNVITELLTYADKGIYYKLLTAALPFAPDASWDYLLDLPINLLKTTFQAHLHSIIQLLIKNEWAIDFKKPEQTLQFWKNIFTMGKDCQALYPLHTYFKSWIALITYGEKSLRVFHQSLMREIDAAILDLPFPCPFETKEDDISLTLGEKKYFFPQKVLELHSAYFKTHFSGKWVFAKSIPFGENYSLTVVESALRFLSGKLDENTCWQMITTSTDLIDLFELASYYIIPRLQLIAQKLIIEKIDQGDDELVSYFIERIDAPFVQRKIGSELTSEANIQEIDSLLGSSPPPPTAKTSNDDITISHVGDEKKYTFQKNRLITHSRFFAAMTDKRWKTFIFPDSVPEKMLLYLQGNYSEELFQKLLPDELVSLLKIAEYYGIIRLELLLQKYLIQRIEQEDNPFVLTLESIIDLEAPFLKRKIKRLDASNKEFSLKMDNIEEFFKPETIDEHKKRNLTILNRQFRKAILECNDQLVQERKNKHFALIFPHIYLCDIEAALSLDHHYKQRVSTRVPWTSHDNLSTFNVLCLTKLSPEETYVNLNWREDALHFPIDDQASAKENLVFLGNNWSTIFDAIDHTRGLEHDIVIYSGTGNKLCYVILCAYAIQKLKVPLHAIYKFLAHINPQIDIEEYREALLKIESEALS